jgi:hypothetical protein
MRNILLTNEHECKAASFAPRWGQQVQWRSLAAAVALVSIFIAAPLSRWNGTNFQSSALELEDRGEAESIKIIARNTGVESAKASSRGATATPGPLKDSPRSSEGLSTASGPATATATAISNTSINRLCSEILASAWRGEALSDQSRAFLQKECR